MKRILFFLAVTSISATMARSQCPMSCDSESFPYIFCTLTGLQITKCSKNPNSELPLVPAKSYMPGCVNVVPINSSLDYQPAGPVPVEDCGTEPFPGPLFPPDKQDIWDRYINSGFTQYGYNYHIPPWYRTYDNHPEDWHYDESEYQAALDQFSLDSSNFFNDLDTAHYDQSGYDDNAITSSDWYFNTDYGWLNEEYTYEEDSVGNDALEEATWVTCDSTFKAQNATGTNVPYEQVWNDAQATSDAQAALNEWLGLCNLKGDPSCCILIKPDNNIKDYQGNYEAGSALIHFDLGLTFGKPGCPDGGCPDPAYRYITYNATNAFFYKNNGDKDLHDPSYILHPSPFQGWYTGDHAPYPTPYGSYANSDFSFKQIVEHEMGHFLGLNHPDDELPDSSHCVNNRTACGGDMLMQQGALLHAGIDAIGIQPDDKCMFQKLYCPASIDDGVSASPQRPEPPSPEIFPNPTTGACQLQYEVLDRAFVQVAIYDVLGNRMRLVSSDYEEPGTRTISLGTESLPSSHYVCRVRVGENVTYINVVVER